MDLDQQTGNVGAPGVILQRADQLSTLTATDADDRHRIVFEGIDDRDDIPLDETQSAHEL